MIVIVVIRGAFVVILFCFRVYQNIEPKKRGRREYEFHAARYFERKGYKCTVQSGVDDGGLDVIARKGRVVLGIQCKLYKGSVGVSVVRELCGVCTVKGFKPVLFTSGKLTKRAREFCREAKIKVIVNKG